MQNYNNSFVLQTKMRTIFKNNIFGFSICKRFSEKCLQIDILPHAILFKMKRPLPGGEKSSSFHLSAHSAAVFLSTVNSVDNFSLIISDLHVYKQNMHGFPHILCLFAKSPSIPRNEKKPCLHHKQGFFAVQTRLVLSANKTCFKSKKVKE